MEKDHSTTVSYEVGVGFRRSSTSDAQVGSHRHSSLRIHTPRGISER